MKVMKILLALLTISWLLSLAFTFQFQVPSPSLRTLELRSQLSKNSEPYTSLLTLTNTDTFGVPAYPYVDTSPTQKKYFFTLAKESYDLQEEPIFYAHKRIAEAIKFYQVLSYEDWQRLLDHYKRYMGQQLAKIESSPSSYVRDTLYAQAFEYLKKHTEDTEALVASIGSDSERINQLIQSTFGELTSQFPERIRDQNTWIFYPLDIATQKEFGAYYLTARLPVSSSSSRVRLYLNDRELAAETASTESAKIAEAGPVQISSVDDTFVLHVVETATAAGRVRPSLYAQESSASATLPASFSIEKIRPGEYRLRLSHMSTRDTESMLHSLGSGWRAALVQQQGNESEYVVSFFPKQLLDILVFVALPFLIVLCGTVVFFHRATVKLKQQVAGQIKGEKLFVTLRTLLQRIRKVLRPVRSLLFWVFLGGLFIDVVLFSATSVAALTIGLTLTWFLVAIAFNIRERTHFALGLLFFLLLPILLVVHRQNIAVKLTNWSYLFLAIGTLELLIRQTYRDYQKDSISDALKALFHDVLKPINRLISGVLIFIHLNIVIITKVAWMVSMAMLALTISSNFVYQSHFYEKYYKTDPLQMFVLGTGVYQLVFIFVFLVLLFLLWRKSSLLLRLLCVLLGVAVIQVVIFNFTSHRIRTQAVITELNKDSGTMWSEITIYGNNFGNAPYNGAAVYVEGVKQRILDWRTDRIIFVVDPINTKTGKLWVVNVDQKKTNELQFEYIPL